MGPRGNNDGCLALAGFQSLPLLPTNKVGPSGADSPGEDPLGLSNGLSCEAGSFARRYNLTGFYHQRF